MQDPGDFENAESPRVAEFSAITDTGRHVKIKHTERFFFRFALHLYHFKCVDHHFSSFRNLTPAPPPFSGMKLDARRLERALEHIERGILRH